MRKLWNWLKWQIAKDQHPAPPAAPVKGEPKWVTRVRQEQRYDFRTGRLNDGSDEK